METTRTLTLFAGDRQIAAGPLPEVLAAAKATLDSGGPGLLLFFEDDGGRQVDFDLRGSPEEVLVRARPAPGPGRPKLGVVSREVTLLPRHWEWLEAQPSGSSAALRRLVEAELRRNPQQEAARRAVEAASRVMTALAGDRPGYEEATRALFAGERRRFEALTRSWPEGIRKYLVRLLRGAWSAGRPSKPTARTGALGPGGKAASRR